jgi:23S rRNA pseudouridine1911/1915/1917 synthase
MRQYFTTVEDKDAGRRLDVFLMEYSSAKRIGISRTSLQRLIQNGFVSIDAVKSLKTHYKLRSGQKIALEVEDKKTAALRAEDIPLDVVYEDEDLAVINKPAGLVVHPAPGNYEHTLVNGLLYRFKNLSDINPLRPGIMHRLDKDTSGLIVIAKNNAAHLSLAKQFSGHSVRKLYSAVVKGRVEFDENIIELPIERHPLKRKNMSVGFSKKSRYAKTRYRTIKRNAGSSLLELEPFTGRTHQLRVHLAYIGHPIMGDKKYGRDNDFVRMALHAKTIGFKHPSSGKYVEFSSDTPKEFQSFFK